LRGELCERPDWFFGLLYRFRGTLAAVTASEQERKAAEQSK
jgi:hypothetical protein